ncbi:MAG: TonB-dependent receptor [Steroidobacteraceae bacterium]
MQKCNRWRHSLWVAPLTFVLGAPALAQEPADSSGIDEVIVTARKREETLIQVPLAITAVTSQQIEREGIKDVKGIIARDPSLNFDTGLAPYDTRIVIRGLSPTRGRPNVATLVDGIDVSSEAIGVAGGSLLINPRLIDIAQIEIVKGPQSALYGRSAFAGAIAYTTADPGTEVSGAASLDFNNQEQSELRANLSLPLGDTLGLRINGYGYSDGGYYRNAATGHKVGGGDGKGGSISLKWQPTDAYGLKFRTEYSDDSYDEPAQAAMPFNARNAVPQSASVCNIGTAQAATGTTAASVGFVIDANCPVNPATLALGLNAYRELERLTGNLGKFDDMSIPAFRGGVGDAKDQGLTAAVNPDYTRSTDNGVTAPEYPGSLRQVLRTSVVQKFDTSFGSFSSLTGYTKARVGVAYDIDKVSYAPIQQNLVTKSITEQFSQELRFTSDFEGPLQFITGLQYWTERMDQTERNISVIGEGTICFATQAFGASTGTQATPGSAFALFPGGPPAIIAPFGSCTGPTGGFTSTAVAPYMDDVDRARASSKTRRTTQHQSAYLEFEWQPIDSLKLIAEARYVDEDNAVIAGFTDGTNGPGTITLCGANGPCRAGNVPSAGIPGIILPPMGFVPPATTRQIAYPTLNESYVTPKGTIQWTPNANLNVYASYSQARKPGGYSTVTLGGTGAPANGDDIRFEAEKLKVYELGAKWRSSSGRLQVNAAAFKTDFTDKQVGTQILVGNTISNRVTNAGAAVLEGLEFAAQWRPTQNWLLGGGLTYFSKYEYTDYRTTSTGAGEIARVGNCTIGYVGSDGAFTALGAGPIPFIPGTTTLRSLTCLLDRTGNHIEDTPEMALALNIGYRHPIGGNGNVLFVDLDANWQDKRFLEDDNAAWLDSYWSGNLRIGIEAAKWSGTLYVDNIADDRTVKSAGTGPAVYASDFRLGAYRYNVAPTVALTKFVFAPSIPTTTFADLPHPRTVGLRFNYRF